MVHTDERLLEQLAAWREAGRKVAVATVVSTWGSSPRPAGSMLIVDEHGRDAGLGLGRLHRGGGDPRGHGLHGRARRPSCSSSASPTSRPGTSASPAAAGSRSMSRRWRERSTLLAALNEARAAKRRVCLVRYLEDGDEALVVDGRRTARRGARRTSPRRWRRRLRRDQSTDRRDQPRPRLPAGVQPAACG